MTEVALFKNGTRVTPLNESAARVGRRIEFKAFDWLETKGWEVFPCRYPTGPVDCVVVNLKTGTKLLLDVKCGGTGKAKARRTHEQQILGVDILRDKKKDNTFYFVNHNIENKTKPITINGVTYKNKKHAHNKLKASVNYRAVLTRMQYYGWTIEEAYEVFPKAHIPRQILAKGQRPIRKKPDIL